MAVTEVQINQTSTVKSLIAVSGSDGWRRHCQ